jgi:membrane protein required for colicin V production
MNGLGIQPYDIFMLAVLALAVLVGAWKGVAWQLASLGSLVLSFLVAMRFGGPLAPYLSTQAPWNRFIAMLILFLLTSLAVWMVFRLVSGVIDRMKLKDWDRQAGALFGLATGIVLCVVITFFAVTLSDSGRETVLQTYSGRYIALLIQKGTPAMPDEVRRALGKYIEELDRKLDPKTPPDAPLGREPGGNSVSHSGPTAAGYVVEPGFRTSRIEVAAAGLSLAIFPGFLAT